MLKYVFGGKERVGRKPALLRGFAVDVKLVEERHQAGNIGQGSVVPGMFRLADGDDLNGQWEFPHRLLKTGIIFPGKFQEAFEDYKRTFIFRYRRILFLHRFEGSCTGEVFLKK